MLSPAHHSPLPTVSLERLFAEHRERVLRLCVNYLRSPSDVEDAMQEAFLRIARRQEHRPLSDAELPGYLTTVARNVCLDELRRRRPTVEYAEQRDQPASDDPEATVINRRLAAEVLGHLSSGERNLVADAFAGVPHAEIAARTGRSPSAVAVALSRLRQRARAIAGVTAGALVWRGVVRARERTRHAAAGLADRLSAFAVPMTDAVPAAATLATATAIAITGLAVVVTHPLGLLASPPHGSGAPVASSIHAVAPPTSAAVTSAATSSPGVAVVTATGPETAPGPPASVRSPGSPMPAPAPHAGAGAVPSATPAPVIGAGAQPLNPQIPLQADPPAAPPRSHGVVDPQQGAQPGDGVYPYVTESPDPQHPSTAYASGFLVSDCGRPSCPVVWRSDDGGASWTQLAASGFAGGPLLLPPSAADPAMFVSSPIGLQESDDAGAGFRLVGPRGPAAVSPRSAPGDAIVLVASLPPVVYDAGSGLLRPGPTLAAGVTAVDGVAFTADGSHVILGAETPDAFAASGWDGVVLRCAVDGACDTSAVYPDEVPLRLAGGADTPSGLVVAYSNTALHLSGDGGLTFRTAAAPLQGSLTAVGMPAAWGGTLDIVEQTEGTAPAPLVLSSPDLGTSFQRLSPVGMPTGLVADSLAQLPGGRLLAGFSGPQVTGVYGLRCSNDSGMQWSVSC